MEYDKILIQQFYDMIKNGFFYHYNKCNSKFYTDEYNISNTEIRIQTYLEDMLHKEIICNCDINNLEQIIILLNHKKFECSLYISKKIHTRYEKYINDISIYIEILDFIKKTILLFENFEINFDINISSKYVIYLIKSITLTFYTLLIEDNLYVIEYINNIFTLIQHQIPDIICHTKKSIFNPIKSIINDTFKK